jgi:putative transposase
MAAIEIRRRNLTARELRAASAKARDAKAARRMLAIALVLEGKDRKTAAETCGMDRQTLRDWVHRYNAQGLAGLENRKGRGRPSRLTTEQKAELAALVESGPDTEQDGVVRWRCVDLKRRIEEMFGVKLHERTVGKQLKALGYVRLSVRPQHPKSDPQAQEAFKKTSPRRSRPFCPGTPVASHWKSGSRTKLALVSRAR